MTLSHVDSLHGCVFWCRPRWKPCRRRRTSAKASLSASLPLVRMLVKFAPARVPVFWYQSTRILSRIHKQQHGLESNPYTGWTAEETKAGLEEHKTKMVAAIEEGKASLAAMKKELDASIGNNRRAGHALCRPLKLPCWGTRSVQPLRPETAQGCSNVEA